MQIMTACTSQENTEGSLTDTAINSNNETTDATSKSDEILDDIILTNAMNSSDSSKCSEILDKEKSSECSNITESLKLIDEAVSTLDESKCNSITLERYKEVCSVNLKEATEIANKNEIQQNEIIKMQTVSQQALDAKDISKCDQLTDAAMYSCRTNVLTNQAIEKNDPTICEQIGDQEFIDGCKMMTTVE